MNTPGKDFALPLNEAGQPIYDYTIIMLLKQYLPAGVLGLGITALLASLCREWRAMFPHSIRFGLTIFTRATFVRVTGDKDADEKHYLGVGRLATIFGVLVSIAAAYLASLFGNIMDFLQTIFSMINAPLFAVIFLGMFWKRTTGHAAFTGLLAGFMIALIHHGLTYPEGADTLVKGGWIYHLFAYPVEMAQNFWTAIFACSTSAIVTVGLSLVTKKIKSDEELKGLVYSLTPKLNEEKVVWYQRSSTLAVFVLAIAAVLTVMFW